MKTILFKIDSSGADGCETSETKMKILEEYKALLIKDGEEILKEREVVNRRGKHVELTLK